MRTAAVFTALLFTASTLAVPLNAAAGGKALEPVKREAAPIVGTVVAKRQGLDLSGLTTLVDGLLNTLTGLLPTITSTVSGLESDVEKLLTDAEADVEGTLTTVQTTVQSLLDQLNSAVGGVNVTGVVTGIESDLSGSISEVESLLSSVESLSGSATVTANVDLGALVSQVTGLVQQLLDTLTGLTGLTK